MRRHYYGARGSALLTATMLPAAAPLHRAPFAMPRWRGGELCAYAQGDATRWWWRWQGQALQWRGLLDANGVMLSI